MPKEVVFDLEADGFTPTKIYCLSFYVDSEVYTMTDYDDMRRFFTAYDVYIGHSITTFDIPVCERILGIKINKQCVDTLPLSWYLFPDRQTGHGLEAYGEDFGIPKPKITDWFSLTLEEYIHRCEEDVKINKTLWDKQYKYLRKLYPDGKEFWRFIRYLQFKMECVREQEEERFLLDIPWCEESIKKLEALQEEKIDRLYCVMPPVPVTSVKNKPKVMYKKDGNLSSHGEKWLLLLASQNLSYDYEGPVEVVTGFEEPNPGSHPQIKKWLFSLGWEPQTFKTNEKGEEVPQISLPFGGGLCPSIKDLYEKEPELEALDGLYVVRHRQSLLNGFLRDNVDGYLRARVAGFTNTLRFKHAEIVNLPKTNVAYGEMARGALIAPEGQVLCGSDMASLEDRLKQHYIYPYDPKYVEEMNVPDFDPHLDLAYQGGEVTEEEVLAYKNGDKSKKKLRDIFKNVNYACQYGAGAPRLTKTGNISLEKAKALHKLYWKRNWSVKQVAEDQKVIYIDDDMWLFNPLSGFYYSLRNIKDIFSTLVQGTAAYVFDVWLGFLRQEGIKLTAQFHDEKVSKHIDTPEERERVERIHFDCIDLLNNSLPLNRKLDIEVKFERRYSEIH